MCSVLYPCANSEKTRLPLWQSSILSEITKTLCQSPHHNLLQLLHIPVCDTKSKEFNADLWEGMAQRIKQMTASNSGEHQVNWALKLHSRTKVVKSLSNFVIARGDQVYDNRRMIETQFSDPYLYSLSAQPVVKCVLDSHKLFQHPKSITVLSNNQSQCFNLENTLVKATMMMESGAYLHHFERYGVEKEKIQLAMIACEE